MNADPLILFLTDDDEDDRLIFSETLDELHCNVNIKMFNDGEELMDYLGSPLMVFPNILLLDLNMPKKNGMKCLKEIRSNPAFNDLFIAIYSTSISDKDIEDTFELGANIYIRKPSNFSKLKKMISELIQLNPQIMNSKRSRVTYMFPPELSAPEKTC